MGLWAFRNAICWLQRGVWAAGTALTGQYTTCWALGFAKGGLLGVRLYTGEQYIRLSDPSVFKASVFRGVVPLALIPCVAGSKMTACANVPLPSALCPRATLQASLNSLRFKQTLLSVYSGYLCRASLMYLRVCRKLREKGQSGAMSLLQTLVLSMRTRLLTIASSRFCEGFLITSSSSGQFLAKFSLTHTLVRPTSLTPTVQTLAWKRPNCLYSAGSTSIMCSSSRKASCLLKGGSSPTRVMCSVKTRWRCEEPIIARCTSKWQSSGSGSCVVRCFRHSKISSALLLDAESASSHSYRSSSEKVIRFLSTVFTPIFVRVSQFSWSKSLLRFSLPMIIQQSVMQPRGRGIEIFGIFGKGISIFLKKREFEIFIKKRSLKFHKQSEICHYNGEDFEGNDQKTVSTYETVVLNSEMTFSTSEMTVSTSEIIHKESGVSMLVPRFSVLLRGIQFFVTFGRKRDWRRARRREQQEQPDTQALAWPVGSRLSELQSESRKLILRIIQFFLVVTIPTTLSARLIPSAILIFIHFVYFPSSAIHRPLRANGRKDRGRLLKLVFGINYIMKNEKGPKYVRRTFQVLVHSATFRTNLGFHFHSARWGQEHSLAADVTVKLNRTLELSTVDLVSPAQRSIDSQLTLDLYANESPAGTVTFDIRKERLVKDDAKSMFRKAFDDRSGHLDYKFLSVETEVVSGEEFAAGEERRNRVLLRKHEDYGSVKRQNAEYAAIQKEKDLMIEALEDKVARLIQQNVEQGRRMGEEIDRLKKPLNILVNIHSAKDPGRERAVSSDPRGRRREVEEAELEAQALRRRLQQVEVENQKLSENCKILIEELHNSNGLSEAAQKRVRLVEKRLAEVDNEYLLTKTISDYDKGKALAVPKTDMQDNIREIQELLEQSKEKEVEELKGSSHRNRNKTLRESNFAKLSKHLSADERSGSLASNQRGGRESMTLRVPSLEGEAMRGSTYLERKDKEIEILENELRKKQAQIERLLHRQGDYERQYQEYQEEKARLFTSLAISSLGQGKAPPDHAAAVKQLNAYNTELLQEKQALLEELRQAKLDNFEKAKKVDSYELATRKSLLFMTHLTKEKEEVEERLKEAVEGERAAETRLLAEKGAQYDALKAQFIECEQDATRSQHRLKDMERANARLTEEAARTGSELEQLRLEKRRLAILVEQAAGCESQVKLLEDKYGELEKLQKGLKTFVMRLESQMNLSMKKKDEELYQAEMKTLLKETYTKINEFEDAYYQTLINAATLAEEAIERYYNETGKFEAEAATSVEKQEALWSNRMALLKERESALKAVHEKQEGYRQKKMRKLLLVEDEFESFLDHYKKLNLRLNEMESYRISLKEFLSEGKIVPYNALLDKHNSSVSSINDRDLSPVPSLPFASFPSPNHLGASLAKSAAKSKGDPLQVTVLSPAEKGKVEQRKRSEVAETELNRSLLYRSANRQELQTLKQMQNSRIVKFQEESQRLKQSFTENLSLREELSREKLEFKKKETRLTQAFNEKVREVERQLQQERSEKDSALNRLRQAESKLDFSVKKLESITDDRLEGRQQELEALRAESRELKGEMAAIQGLLEKASEELLFLSNEERRAREEARELGEERVELLMRLKSYEESENFLLQEIRSMKEGVESSEAEVARTIEELSSNFVKIEKVKSGEIEKLRGIVEQLEGRLEEEASEAMSLRERIEELEQQLSETEALMAERREEWQMAVEGLQRELNGERDARESLESENKQYYSNILELSDSVEAHEREMLRLNVLIEGSAKEKRLMEQMAARLGEKEAAVREEGRRMEQTTREKNEQLRKWERDYQQLSTEVKYISKELETAKADHVSVKELNERLREQLFEKEREIIGMEKEKGIAMINIEKLHVEIDGLSTQLVLQENRIKELSEANEHFAELRTTDKNQSQGRSPENKLEKSRRGELFMSKAITAKEREKEEDSFFGNREMKISRRLPDLNNLSALSHQSKSSEKSSRGLAVPVMKTNKMLNLPSIDSDPPFTEEENNLQIIQEHQEELNDTFLDPQRASNTISDDLIEIRIKNEKNKRVDEQNRTINSSPYRAQQSGVHIVADFTDLDDQDLRNIERFESPETFGIRNEQYEQYEGVNREELIEEMVRLRQEIAELQTRVDKGDPLGISRIKQNLGQTYKSQRSFLSGRSKEMEAANALKPEKSFRILKQQSRDSNQTDNFQNHILEERIKELQAENAALKEAEKALKEKLSSDELYIAEVEQKLRMAEKEVEDQERSVNELIEELKKVSELNCLLQSQVEAARQEYANLKERLKSELITHQARCEQLISEALQKDSQMYDLEVELGKVKEASQSYAALIADQEQQIKEANSRVRSFQANLKKQQKSYITYEEQSQLQILKLREEVDALKLKLLEKQDEVKLLAEKYLLMEETNCSLLSDLKQQEAYFEDSEKANAGLASKFESVRGEIEGNENFRKNTLKKLHDLELENVKLKQSMANLTKNAGIEAQKWTIRLSAERESLTALQGRVKDKETVILQLKNQIALYNQECDELKQLNEALNSELLKAERGLKEVMGLYESQLQTLNQQASCKASIATEAAKSVKTIEREMDSKNKEIRECREEIKQLRDENQEIRDKLSRLKVEYNQIKANLSNQAEHKKDEYQTLMLNMKIVQKNAEEMSKKAEIIEHSLRQRIGELQQKGKRLQSANLQLKASLQSQSKKPTKDNKGRSDIMMSILQERLRKVTEQVESYKSMPRSQKPQANDPSSLKQIQSLQTMIVSEKQKNANLCSDLKQVVQAFKALEQEKQQLKKKKEAYKEANSTLSSQNRHLQRQVKQLQEQMQELQKDLSSVRFSRLNSFSKILTDTTIK